MGAADTVAALEGASLPGIVGIGLLLGLVHVLTGPDHLSALIVLSAGSSWRSCQLGMRWGCGHSTGLVVVTACFLALNRHLDVDTFGSYCDFMVGFLMMGLGLWSLRYYVLLGRRLRLKHQPAGERTPLQLEAELQEDVDSDSEVQKILHAHHLDHKGPSETSTEVQEDQPVTKTCCFGLVTADIKNPHTQKLTAFAYGRPTAWRAPGHPGRAAGRDPQRLGQVLRLPRRLLRVLHLHHGRLRSAVRRSHGPHEPLLRTRRSCAWASSRPACRSAWASCGSSSSRPAPWTRCSGKWSRGFQASDKVLDDDVKAYQWMQLVLCSLGWR